MIRTLLAAGFLLAIGTGAAQAQGKIFKCKNEKGEAYYSQSYDARRCAGGGAQMNQQGVAVKAIDRVKTPEELAAEQTAAEVAAAKKKVADLQTQSDNVLLLSYPGEADLERSYTQEIESVDGMIKTTELSIQSHEKSLGELLAAAADAERAKQPVSETLTKSINTVRTELEAQRALIDRKNAEKATLSAAYQQRLTRFRELKARQAEHLSGKPSAN